jgi:hypothetical protein
MLYPSDSLNALFDEICTMSEATILGGECRLAFLTRAAIDNYFCTDYHYSELKYSKNLARSKLILRKYSSEV